MKHNCIHSACRLALRPLRCTLTPFTAALLLLAPAGNTALLAAEDDHWSDAFGLPSVSKYDAQFHSRVPGTITAVAVAGTNVYIGGDFNLVGGYVQATNFAVWNGRIWSPVGPGFDAYVRAIAVVGNEIYVGGSFTNVGSLAAHGLARWNGSEWASVGGGVVQTNPYLAGGVYALAVKGADVYLGGNFTAAGNVDARNIAKWNGSVFSPLGDSDSRVEFGSLRYGNGVNASVYALTFVGDELYAGGQFFAAYNSTNAVVNSPCIARWNGSAWSAVGSGIGSGYGGDAVNTLLADATDLYVGGNFNSAGGLPAKSVVKWNGTAWSALGAGLSGETVRGLALVGGKLTALSSKVRQWDGSAWSELASISGSGFEVLDVIVPGPNQDYLVAGNFSWIGNAAAGSIARYDGTNWWGLGLGGGVTVNSVHVAGSNVYVGGRFDSIGGVFATNVARWDGARWWPLGGGVGAGTSSDAVNAIATFGSALYVGGVFSGPNGTNLARWDGTNWTAMALPSSSVYALLGVGTSLYVGGEFQSIGSLTAHAIARYDGQNWFNVGSATAFNYQKIYALVSDGTNVYAGGRFSFGAPGNHIAKWNGSSWSGLGSGMASFGLAQVKGLALSGSNLFAAGSFTSAGGVNARNIAGWNGVSWFALGDGLGGGNDLVYGVATMGDSVFASGSFTNAGTLAATRIARWHQGAWSALGSGIDAQNAYAYGVVLATQESQVLLGGGFSSAGGKAAANFSIWTEAPAGTVPLLLGTTRQNKSLTISWPAGFPSVVLEGSPTPGLGAEWTPIPSSGNSATIPIDTGSRFFRVRVP